MGTRALESPADISDVLAAEPDAFVWLDVSEPNIEKSEQLVT